MVLWVVFCKIVPAQTLLARPCVLPWIRGGLEDPAYFPNRFSLRSCISAVQVGSLLIHTKAPHLAGLCSSLANLSEALIDVGEMRAGFSFLPTGYDQGGTVPPVLWTWWESAQGQAQLRESWKC